MRIVKQRLLEMIPELSVFLDVDDLEDISNLEGYIETSQHIFIYCSKGYFQSRNCMRELAFSVRKGKPIIACLDLDASRGGLSLEQIKTELAQAEESYEKWSFASDTPKSDELFAALTREDPLEWTRIGAFQDVTMRLIAERTLPLGLRYSTLARDVSVGLRQGFAGAVASAASPVQMMVAVGASPVRRLWNAGRHSGREEVASSEGEVPPGCDGELAVGAPEAEAGASDPDAPMPTATRPSGTQTTSRASSAPSSRRRRRIGLPRLLRKPLASEKSLLFKGHYFVQGELSNMRVTLPAPNLADKGHHFHVYVSPHNDGGAELMSEVASKLKVDVQCTSELHDMEMCERCLVYLNGKTWTSAEKSARLAEDVRKAMAVGTPILLAHEMIGFGGQEARFGCEFQQFFGCEDGATPPDLLHKGIYAQIAVALKGGPWRDASMVLLGRELANFVPETPKRRGLSRRLSRSFRDSVRTSSFSNRMSFMRGKLSSKRGSSAILGKLSSRRGSTANVGEGSKSAVRSPSGQIDQSSEGTAPERKISRTRWLSKLNVQRSAPLSATPLAIDAAQADDAADGIHSERVAADVAERGESPAACVPPLDTGYELNFEDPLSSGDDEVDETPGASASQPSKGQHPSPGPSAQDTDARRSSARRQSPDISLAAQAALAIRQPIMTMIPRSYEDPLSSDEDSSGLCVDDRSYALAESSDDNEAAPTAHSIVSHGDGRRSTHESPSAYQRRSLSFDRV